MSAPHLQDAYGTTLAAGRELARGRHADLLLSGDGKEVFKVYLVPPTATQARKVEGMVSPRHKGAAPSRVLWPSAALYGKNRQLTGLSLPLPPEGLSHTRPLRPLLRQDTAARSYAGQGWGFRVKVAAALAGAVTELHAQGHLLGDVRPEHVLVTDAGEIWLVGSDDFQLRLGEETFAPYPSPAEYLPHEAQAAGNDNILRQHAPAEDLFGLAVLLFEILLARHPYAGVWARGQTLGPVEAIAEGAFVDAQPSRAGFSPAPDALPFAALSPKVQVLFRQAFGKGQEQPTASAWAAALGEMERQLKPCETSGQHQQVAGQPCAECAVGPQGSLGQHDNLAARVEQLWRGVAALPAPTSPVIPAVTQAPPLPPLPLGLPEAPRGFKHTQQEQLLSWLLRLLTLGALMVGTWFVQHSFVAVLVIPAIVLFAFTLGKTFMVDWDGLIERYQKWERGLIDRFLPQGGQQQVYRQQVLARRQEVQTQLGALRSAREDLRVRYEKENAGASFLREQHQLEKRRNVLLSRSKGGGLEALYQRWRERLERDFLRTQNLRSGQVPGVGVRELSLAVARGIRTAVEVEDARVEGLPVPLGRELTAWRGRLQDFLPFDPSQIPRGEIVQLRRFGHDQIEGEYQDFADAVRQFVRTNWQAREKEISRELGLLEAQIEQHKALLKKLKALEK